MLRECFYLITPREALNKALLNSDNDLREFITERRLWKNREPDRSAWTNRDHLFKVKIGYLFWIHECLNDFEEERQAIFGKEKIKVELFDKFWDCEKFDGIDQDADDALGSAKKAPWTPTQSKLLNEYISTL